MPGPTRPAPASSCEIMAYIRHYGYQRLHYGSSVPFGHSVSELEKVFRLDIDETVK